MATYTLQGNAGVAGALITLSGAASATVTADTIGNYQFSGLAAGSYTITPSLTGYTFAPTSTNETIVAANILGINFVATLTSDSGAASTVDSRTTGSNSSLNQNGTQINVVSATPSYVPPVDCRVNVPQDCRVNKPVNSRA